VPSPFRRRNHGRLPVEDVERLVRRWLPAFRQLDLHDRATLLEFTDVLVHELRWEASKGFAVDDDMRVAISAHAALLVLHLDDGLQSYIGITSVIVHPTIIEIRGITHVGGGIVTTSSGPLIGEAHHAGPVLVSWDAAAEHALHPERGENVLFHEFAHRLDMIDGLSDGTPPFADRHELTRWVEVCTRSLRALRESGEPSVLRSYGALNPAEFFAVATEVFFTRGAALREENPALYDVLRTYYVQDPARRT
jgi:Mlc titration factor MtfA (ptsG expression regulator)